MEKSQSDQEISEDFEILRNIVQLSKMAEYVLDDLTKVYVSYGPFKHIRFNSIDLRFYRDGQGKLSADFKYDIQFGAFDPQSSRQLFIGIDVSDVPGKFKDDEIGYEYQTASYISDVKDQSYYIVNDSWSKISLPSKSSPLIYWTFEVDAEELSHVRATASPLNMVNIPVYLHEDVAKGHGIIYHRTSLSKMEPSFNVLVDLDKNRNMIEFVPTTDFKLIIDKLDTEEKKIFLNLLIKDLPKYALPDNSKEVTREIILETLTDGSQGEVEIDRNVKDSQFSLSTLDSSSALITINDDLIHDKSYVYTPMAPKWFLAYT